ncbi:Uncharacterised protein [Zhongshania aliphaticivorans]|uniref:Lipid A 3-O-deacylase PagL n=1 Tax=Zhongshania aliphaticivorans TaxID=1470434 RepID=A0A5S9P108_9GAMM|nr:acyloxyacyl hydrolase [Zhongshania aliphaticivorans]CAA0089837.1 Uncharacterised protein [Zhongshania aliphaticivorans]CAA0096895.1 Uncharacterised protein [Zhongshania aliphaticivorans]
MTTMKCIRPFCLAITGLLISITTHADTSTTNALPEKIIIAGALAHNKGPIASETEDGPDINFAYHHLLKRFDNSGLYGHGGAVINLADGTSYAYLGGTGRLIFGSSPFYAELGGGFAVHDGDLEKKSDDKRELGSRILFRFEISAGYQINDSFSASIFMDHISNGSILNDDNNRGLDTYGLRLGYSY